MAAEHPFVTAWRTRDPDAWAAALAEDVVVRSPVLRAPFRGQVPVRDLYAVLFEEFGRIEFIHVFEQGDTHAFYWRGEIGGRTIEGNDLIRSDADGKITEITVFIRPLPDIGVFAAAAGPAVARRQSRTRAAIMRVLGGGLRAMLAASDRIATRLQ